VKSLNLLLFYILIPTVFVLANKLPPPYEYNGNLLKHDLAIPSRALRLGEERAGVSVPRHRQLTRKEDPMDAHQLKWKWVQFKGALKTRWGRFRDDHLVQSEGGYDKSVDQAHERHGDKKDELMKRTDQRHQQSAPAQPYTLPQER